jgi:hypothetical protein
MLLCFVYQAMVARRHSKAYFTVYVSSLLAVICFHALLVLYLEVVGSSCLASIADAFAGRSSYPPLVPLLDLPSIPSRSQPPQLALSRDRHRRLPTGNRCLRMRSCPLQRRAPIAGSSAGLLTYLSCFVGARHAPVFLRSETGLVNIW